uniref:F-box domain-containing protein n=1 Tax=Anopheles maculatus TaxID=74869 RepID=A0A182STB9_9DIPT
MCSAFAWKKRHSKDIDPASLYLMSEIQQYVATVIYASSEYGPSSSISYNAINIIGRPNNFPVHGDHSDSYLLPSYGNWKLLAPSFTSEFGLTNVPAVDNPPVDDFIVVRFEGTVCPTGVEVYETLSPGAIYRIWAYTEHSTWVLLWDKRFDRLLDDVRNHRGGKTRVFLPEMRRMEHRTCVLRFEFCTRDLTYISGIDGIMLKSLLNETPNFRRRETFVRETIDEIELEWPEERSITDLPYEMIFKICSYLDLKSLRNLEKASPTFHSVVRDPRLYREVNMRPYWMDIDAHLLAWLEARCAHIRKLDLSWCGLFGAITARDLQRLVPQHGHSLTHLRLNSVPFCDGTDFVLSSCPNVTELCLQNMDLYDQVLMDSKLTKLTRLDVSGGSMSDKTLENILKLNPFLQHLNLSCFNNMQFKIADTIGRYNRDLISLNLFKTRALSADDLRPLANCTKLQELNLGYANHDEVQEGDLSRLAEACACLRKLVLAGFRDVHNNDLLTIAQHCSALEYLDLMGCITVTGESVNAIFIGCSALRFLEIHHCNGITYDWVPEWGNRYPDVDIKFEEY